MTLLDYLQDYLAKNFTQYEEIYNIRNRTR